MNRDVQKTTGKVSGMSIVAFVCSFFGCIGIAGIVLGIIDLTKSDGRKRGLSIAAIVIGSVMTLASFGALGGGSTSDNGLQDAAHAELVEEKAGPASANTEIPADSDPITEDKTTEVAEPTIGVIESSPDKDKNVDTSTDELVPEETTDSTAERESDSTDVSNRLEVHYIDVGQGDAALIICGNEAMLVDAGGEDKGTAVQNYLKKHNVGQLKYVMASHPDADHIGGLDVIVYKYDCGQILVPNCSNDTSSFDQLQQSMRAKGYSAHVVDIGEKYMLGDAQIEILSPSTEFTFADTNDSSIVFRLDHGENSFLFTGDATIPPQQALIYDSDLNIDVDVLKVPHHGASTAYIKGFYDEVSPEYAVISCGRGNRYGHPRPEVLDDLKARGTKLYRTDEQGTIVAVSDGKTITFDTEPSDNWLPGEIIESVDSGENVGNANANGFQHNLSEAPEAGVTYVYNSNTGKFHRPGCSSVTDIKPKNRVDVNCSKEELLQMYPDASPCKKCKP